MVANRQQRGRPFSSVGNQHPHRPPLVVPGGIRVNKVDTVKIIQQSYCCAVDGIR